MLKKLMSLIIMGVVVGSLVGCSSKDNNDTKQVSSIDSKVQVVVSFNPMKEFVEAIGKDKVDVHTVVPSGTEPHEFEPKAKDMEKISKAKVFIYNGLGMEQWVEKTLNAIDNKNLLVVEASKGADLIKNNEDDKVKEHGQFDPHIWLSLKEAKVEIKNIKDALINVDSKNKDFYEKNYNDYISQLDKLYNDYKPKFDSLTNKNFVTGHAAFAYLCRDFGLKQNSVENAFAEGEPTPQKLKDLVEYCKNGSIKVVFMEEMASPKVSETLAKELNGRVQKIYTIESSEDNKTYVESMKENLENIYNSMK